MSQLPVLEPITVLCQETAHVRIPNPQRPQAWGQSGGRGGVAGGEKWSSISWVVLTGKQWWSPCISCSYHSGHIGCCPWNTLSKVEIRFGLWKVCVAEAEPALKWMNPHTANQRSLCQVPKQDDCNTASQQSCSHNWDSGDRSGQPGSAGGGEGGSHQAQSCPASGPEARIGVWGWWSCLCRPATNPQENLFF